MRIFYRDQYTEYKLSSGLETVSRGAAASRGGPLAVELWPRGRHRIEVEELDGHALEPEPERVLYDQRRVVAAEDDIAAENSSHWLVIAGQAQPL